MIAGLVLCALLVAAATVYRTGRAGAVLLGLLSLLWFVVNGSMEGDVLWTVVRGHGLTAGDLVGLVGLALSVWWLARPGR